MYTHNLCFLEIFSKTGPCNTNIFSAVKNESCHLNSFDNFIIFIQNIDRGLTFNEYPQSVIWIKIKNNCVPLHIPVLLYITRVQMVYFSYTCFLYDVIGNNFYSPPPLFKYFTNDERCNHTIMKTCPYNIQFFYSYENENLRQQNFYRFSYLCSKHKLWVHVTCFS